MSPDGGAEPPRTGTQAPAWWIAADGRWYPPHLDPRPGPSLPGWPAPVVVPAPPDDLRLRQGASTRRPPRRGVRRAVVTLAALLAAAVLFVAGVLIGRPTATPARPTVARLATPRPAAGAVGESGGHVVFADDFADPSSGWPTKPLEDGTTFTYGRAGYRIVTRSASFDYAFAPYTTPIEEVSVRATARRAPAPSGAAFGVGCVASAASLASQVRYQFVVTTPGLWSVERIAGDPSELLDLRAGRLAAPPGSRPLTVEGVCDTVPGGRGTSRIEMFVDGRRVVSLLDRPPGVASPGPVPSVPGWFTTVGAGADDATPMSATVDGFQVRDLSD